MSNVDTQVSHDMLLAEIRELRSQVANQGKAIQGLLEGVSKFVSMADQMKGHPLFAAFAPPKNSRS